MRNRGKRCAYTAATSLLFVGVLANPSDAAIVDVSAFNGGFSTSCDLPYTPDGSARSGSYTCQHSASSVVCVPLCSAELVSGTTSGFVVGSEPVRAQVWYCWDGGSGTGRFRYQPGPTDPAFEFDVSLTMNLATRLIDVVGSYIPEAGGVVTVRASFPAACNPHTSGATGFFGGAAPV
jgi:hypothetical protein